MPNHKPSCDPRGRGIPSSLSGPSWELKPRFIQLGSSRCSEGRLLSGFRMQDSPTSWRSLAGIGCCNCFIVMQLQDIGTPRHLRFLVEGGCGTGRPKLWAAGKTEYRAFRIFLGVCSLRAVVLKAPLRFDIVIFWSSRNSKRCAAPIHLRLLSQSRAFPLHREGYSNEL